MQHVEKEGFSICISGIFSPMQAYMAAAGGADYVSATMRRIEWMEIDPYEVVSTIIDIFRSRKLSCQLIAGSVRTSDMLTRLLRGPDIDVSVPPALLREVFDFFAHLSDLRKNRLSLMEA